MKVEFEGATWDVDFLGADMLQADAIAAYTGLSLLAWYNSLLDTDSVGWNKSIRCLYWLMLAQNPQHGPAGLIEESNFKPFDLFRAFTAGMAEEKGEDAEPDPTKPAGVSDGEARTPPPTLRG